MKNTVSGGCFPVVALGKCCICFGYSCVIAWDIHFLVMFFFPCCCCWSILTGIKWREGARASSEMI